MFGLSFIPKNTEIQSSNVLNTKASSKKSNKDFVEFLEGQKDNIKNSTMETKKETKIADTLEKEKPIVKETNKENTSGKIKELEENSEEEIKLMTILQSLFSLYNLLEDLDLEAGKLKESIFDSMEIEIEKTLNLLETLVNKESIPNEEFLLETLGKVEEFIELMEAEMEEYKVKIGEDLEFPVEKGLVQLEKEVEILKSSLGKAPNLLMEDEIEFEDNLEGDLNIVEKTSMEIKNTTEEDFTDNREDIGTNSFKEETEIKNTENPVSNFEIKTSAMYRENNLSEVEKPQNFDTKEIIEQIVDKAKIVVDDFKQEIKISLKPEILGDVVLKMETVKEGLVTKIMVDNYKTKELIEANLYQLKEEMKENGLEIKTFEVFVGTNEDFQREKSQEFYLNKKPKKVKIKNGEIEEIKTYDDSVFQRDNSIYAIDGQSKLNLFA